MSASVFPMTSCSTKPQSCSQSAEGESVTHGYPPLTSHLIYPKKISHISSSLPWPPSLLRWAHTTAPSAAVVVSKTKLRAVSRSSMASSRLRPPGKGACSRRELMARIARREISRRSDSARRQRVRLHPPPGQAELGALEEATRHRESGAPWARARASAASTGSGTGAVYVILRDNAPPRLDAIACPGWGASRRSECARARARARARASTACASQRSACVAAPTAGLRVRSTCSPWCQSACSRALTCSQAPTRRPPPGASPRSTPWRRAPAAVCTVAGRSRR